MIGNGSQRTQSDTVGRRKYAPSNGTLQGIFDEEFSLLDCLALNNLATRTLHQKGALQGAASYE